MGADGGGQSDYRGGYRATTETMGPQANSCHGTCMHARRVSRLRDIDVAVEVRVDVRPENRLLLLGAACDEGWTRG